MPQVFISIVRPNSTERFDEGQVVAIDLALSAASSEVVTVHLSDPWVNIRQGDLTLLDPVVTFQPGETSTSARVRINDDTEFESDELMKIEIAQVEGAIADVSEHSGAGTHAEYIFYVNENDQPSDPLVSIVRPNSTERFDEGQVVAIDLALSAASSEVVTVHLSDPWVNIRQGDLTLLDPVVTFQPGETSTSARVRINDDTEFESDELMKIEIAQVEGAIADVSEHSGAGTHAEYIFYVNENDRRYLGSDAAGSHIGDADDNLAYAYQGSDYVSGLAGRDTIYGGGGNDTLLGGEGYDWLVPGTGNDTVDGGADRDMVSFSDLPEVAGRTNLDFMLTLDLGAGTANLFGGETNTLNSIERVTGSIFTDVMRGSDGNDELRGIGDYDWFIATPGNDTLDGGNGLDMVSFVEGTYSGATVVQDVFSVDGAPPSGAAVGGVLLDLTTPADNVGLADGLTLISVERVTGSSHQDVFYGDSNQNDFRGLGGYDWFVSSTGGRERYFGGDGLDTVTYFQSTDGVGASLRNSSYIVSGQETGYGTAGDAVRDLFYEIENLVGSNYDDSLTGNEERNQLAGLDGDDIIFGYGNIDYIKGGAGNDMINGGAGSDFALYDGNRADYTITRTSSTEVEIAGGGFTDFLENVEYFQFDDETANIWQFSVA